MPAKPHTAGPARPAEFRSQPGTGATFRDLMLRAQFPELELTRRYRAQTEAARTRDQLQRQITADRALVAALGERIEAQRRERGRRRPAWTRLF
jgi:hypothetical protein